MRRIFYRSGFGSALRNELWSTGSAAVKSSNVLGMARGFSKVDNSEMGSWPSYNNSVYDNLTVAAGTEQDDTAQLYDTSITDLTPFSLTALRRIALLDPDLALSIYNKNKKVILQRVLINIQSAYQKIELKKDPSDRDRDKQPWEFPIAEIECDRIAGLSIEEPLIVFVESFFFGEKGYATGTSTHATFYSDNKGVPLHAIIGRNVNGCKQEAGPYALERSLFHVVESFYNSKCRIFCSDKSTVKGVQERMKRLKEGKRVSNHRFTEIAKSLVENGSTIEFIAKKDNIIAGFLAFLMGKVGDVYLYSGDLPPEDETALLF